MKQILIALDYDPSAQKVAEAGFELATGMDAEVTLLHVIADPTYYSSTAYSPIMGFGGYADLDFLEPDIKAELTNASYQFLTKTKEHLKANAMQLLVSEGDVAATILEAAKKIHAGTIVMGSHSRKWLETVLLGSVAEKVLRHSDIPLFIVPTKKQP